MTTEEILEKAISKATDRGWDGTITNHYFTLYDFKGTYTEPFIFNHNFAKALWPATVEIDTEPEYAEGDQEIGGIPWNTHETVEAWSYHLQQMVLAEDPIKYLGENI